MTLQERINGLFQKYSVNLSAEPVELAQATLENGTVIATDADAFAVGVQAYVTNDEGEKIPLPDGEYTLENGTTFTVAEGSISEMNEPAPAEEADPAEAPTETLSEEEAVEPEAQPEAEPEALGNEDKVEAYRQKLEEAVKPADMEDADKESMVNALLKIVEEALTDEDDKEDMSDLKEEMASHIEALRAELSEQLAEKDATIQKLAAQAAEEGLKRVTPTVKTEPVNLANLNPKQRVQELMQRYQ